MIIISIINQKGGVGKTTTALELCSNLKGKVLAIDMDPQGSMTEASEVKFNGSQEVYSLKDVLDGTPVEKAIQHSNGYDLIAASKALANSAKMFTEADEVFILDDILKQYMKAEYDYVVIDSAPGRSPLLNMAYVASDYIIIPLDADPDSLKGIDEVLDDIAKFKSHGMSHAKVLGSFIVAYEKTTVHELANSEMKKKMESYGLQAFKTNIRKTVRVKEAKILKMSLTRLAKEDRGVIKAKKDYEALTKEILKRIKDDQEHNRED